MGGTFSTDSPVWKRTLQGRLYKWWAMSRGCIYSYFSQDKIYNEEIKQYLNRMQKKSPRRTVHQDLLKTDRAENLGTGCSWIAGWWDLEGVLGKAQVFHFLCYFCKHLLLDTAGQRKKQIQSDLRQFGWCFYKIMGKQWLVLWGLHRGGWAGYVPSHNNMH